MWLISITECRIEFLRSLKFSPKMKDHSALCLFVCDDDDDGMHTCVVPCP